MIEGVLVRWMDNEAMRFLMTDILDEECSLIDGWLVAFFVFSGYLFAFLFCCFFVLVC